MTNKRRELLRRVLVMQLILVMLFQYAYTDKALAATGIYIAGQPVSVSAKIGQTVTVSVTAYGNNLKYQWQYYEYTSRKWNYLNTASSKNSSMTFAFRKEYDNLMLRCIVYTSTSNYLYSNSCLLTLKKDEGSVEESAAESSATGETSPETETTAPAETTTRAPETTTRVPETTTAPETTTRAPETTTVPETTTRAPETTTAPETEDVITGNGPYYSQKYGNFVTPEMYGAKGDGKTDDSKALQSAIDSGYNVVLSTNKTYYLSASSYLFVSKKNNFHMYGGNIHKAASVSENRIIYIRDSKNCSFEGMYIYSEFTVKESGTNRASQYNSCQLAFAGVNNENIIFKNNSFAYMNADYWLVGTSAYPWKNVTIDGWTSSTTKMPFYGTYIYGMTMSNANVTLHENGVGPGDHNIYLSTGSRDVTIKDSYFTWNGKQKVCGCVNLLCFRSNSTTASLYPQNTVLDNVTVDAKDGRAIYVEGKTSLTIKNSNISNSPDLSTSSQPGLCGDGEYEIYNTSITSNNYTIAGPSKVYLSGCTLKGGDTYDLMVTVPNLTVEDSKLTVTNGEFYYATSSTNINHIYRNTEFVKTVKKNYSFSKRTTSGTMVFNNCTIDCGGTTFMYNGGRIKMTGITLYNTRITNAAKLAETAEASGYTTYNSYINGSLIR